jgi:hypothetical protein
MKFRVMLDIRRDTIEIGSGYEAITQKAIDKAVSGFTEILAAMNFVDMEYDVSVIKECDDERGKKE